MKIRSNWFYYVFFSLVTYAMTQNQGCQRRANEYALPGGSVEAGKSTFVELGCNSCHSVSDIEWSGQDGQGLHFPLGGETTRVKTYGELVTSIINPSHKVDRDYMIQMGRMVDVSPMTNYNEVMTVQELVDLVTFLQDEYELIVPEFPYDIFDL